MAITGDNLAPSLALSADPMDWLARLAWSDALEEDGRTGRATAQRRVAECIKARSVPGNWLGKDGKAWVTNVKKLRVYKGRKVRFVVATSFIASELGWSGGTRSYWYYHNLYGDHYGPACSGLREGDERSIARGKPVVEKCWFQGKNCGLRVYVHPDDVEQLIG